MISGLVIDDLALVRGERRLFAGLSFTVAAGEAVALTGPNGSGKTSLLRAIAGLLRPEAGTVTFTGENGASLEADDARAGGLHLLGHHDGLKSVRTAREELEFWSLWMGGGPDTIARAIATFELGPLLDLDVRKLSAGQRRRLALARLIAAPRRLWLLDEPMAPRDARRRAMFGELMAAHLAEGGLILAAVHDPLPLPARSLSLDEAMV